MFFFISTDLKEVSYGSVYVWEGDFENKRNLFGQRCLGCRCSVPDHFSISFPPVRSIMSLRYHGVEEERGSILEMKKRGKIYPSNPFISYIYIKYIFRPSGHSSTHSITWSLGRYSSQSPWRPVRPPPLQSQGRPYTLGLGHSARAR